MSTFRTLVIAAEATQDQVRVPLRTHRSCKLIGECSGGEEAIQFVTLSQPDLVIIGWTEETPALLSRLAQVAPWARTLVLEAPGDYSGGPSASIDTLGATIDRLAHPEEPAAPPRRDAGKILVVYGAKGGAGRSQLATNLAIALARTGRETLLLDGAMYHGEQDLLLNLQPQQGIAAILSGSRVDTALCQHPTGLKLLAWNKGERSVATDRLKSLLLWLKQRDCWVVVDTHPALRDLNRVFLEQAHRTYVPMFLDIAHLRAVQRDLALLRDERVDTSGFEFLTWGERTDVSRQEASQILKRPIDWQLPFDPAKVKASINQGIPILQSEPHGSLAKELGRLVETMVEPSRSTALVPFKENPLQSFWSWFKRGPSPGYGA